MIILKCYHKNCIFKLFIQLVYNCKILYFELYTIFPVIATGPIIPMHYQQTQSSKNSNKISLHSIVNKYL